MISSSSLSTFWWIWWWCSPRVTRQDWVQLWEIPRRDDVSTAVDLDLIQSNDSTMRCIRYTCILFIELSSKASSSYSQSWNSRFSVPLFIFIHCFSTHWKSEAAVWYVCRRWTRSTCTACYIWYIQMSPLHSAPENTFQRKKRKSSVGETGAASRGSASNSDPLPSPPRRASVPPVSSRSSWCQAFNIFVLTNLSMSTINTYQHHIIHTLADKILP